MAGRGVVHAVEAVRSDDLSKSSSSAVYSLGATVVVEEAGTQRKFRPPGSKAGTWEHTTWEHCEVPRQSGPNSFVLDLAHNQYRADTYLKACMKCRAHRRLLP